MNTAKKLYTYSGNVSIYRADSPVHGKFKSSTMAVSAKQAASNIKWQYRRQNGLASTVPVNLLGNLVCSN